MQGCEWVLKGISLEVAIDMAFVFVIFAVTGSAAIPCLDEYCPALQVKSNQRGDGTCDAKCMESQCGFDSSQVDSDCWEQCSLSCTAAQWGNGLCDAGMSHTDCDTAECGWDKGDCGYCSSGCKHYLGWEHSLGNGVCEPRCNSATCNYDGGDCITAETPVAVYVAAESNSALKVGTVSDPYDSLESALESVWAPFTVVYLLQGSHFLRFSASPQSFLIATTVRITTLRCDFTAIPQCSNSPAIIQLTADDVQWVVTGQLTIGDVEVVGNFPLKPECHSALCLYCPAVLSLEDGTIEDDRGAVVTEYAEQSLCDKYHSSALIRVGAGGILHLADARFIDIRHQLHSLVISECGTVDLRNTEFSGIMTQRAGVSGGVFKHFSSSGSSCGSFHMTGGLIELLNNGYEYAGGDAFSGFASFRSVTEVRFSGVRAQYNSLLGEFLSPTALLFFQSVGTTEIYNSTFAHNLETVILLDDPAMDPGHESLVVSNSTFEGCYGTIISATASRTSVEMTIFDCSFERNVGNEVGLVYLDGGKGNSRFVSWGLWIQDNCAPMAIEVVNVVEFNLSRSQFWGNGEIDQAASTLLSSFISSAATYMSLSPSFPSIVCIGTLLATAAQSFFVRDCDFVQCICLRGSPGLTQTVAPVSMEVSDLRFLDNLGQELFAIEVAHDVTLSRLQFLRNANEHTNRAVCFGFTATAPLDITISDSTFKSNRGFQNTFVNVSGVKGVTFQRVIAANNSAVRTSAGFVFYPYNKDNSFVTVRDSSFEDNSAFASGLITITDATGEVLSAENRLTLIVSNTTFVRNLATQSGSCISISGFIFLSNDSYIRDCEFIDNSCDEGGACVQSHYLTGSLTIAATVFRGNKGNNGAAVWSTHKGSGVSLAIDSCDFIANVGESVLSLETDAQMRTSNCRFLSSSATAVNVYQGQWEDSASQFINNTGVQAGAIALSTFAFASLHGSILANNTGLSQGGGATAWISSELRCVQCRFEGNSCRGKGGALYLEERASFVASDTVFRNNVAEEKGAVLLAVFSTVECRACRFERNLAWDYAAMLIMGSHALIEDSVFSENRAMYRTPGVMLSQSFLSVLRCRFLNQSGDLGNFLSANDESQVLISASFFTGGYALNYGGCIYITVNSSVIMTDSEFTACTARMSGSVLMMRTGRLEMRNVRIHDISSPLGSGAVVVVEGSASLQVHCEDLTGSAIIGSGSTILIEDSEFSHITANIGAALSCSECMSVTAVRSTFHYSLSKKGGAVYLYSSGSISIDPTSTFTNCTFAHNRAVNGGGLYSESMFVYMNGCYFLNNSVSPDFYDSVEILKRGIGAGIYAVNANLVVALYQIVGNRFVNNTASYAGAALYWFDTYPQLSNNSFEGNAAPYGSEVASFPTRLSIVAKDGSFVNYTNADDPPLALTLTDIVSGQLYTDTIRVALIDQYNKVVTIDSDSSAQILSAEQNSSAVSGKIQVTALQGFFEFTDMTFVGVPKSTQIFLITSDGVNVYLKKFTSDPTPYYPTLKVAVTFRDCIAGEAYQGLTCYLCQPGTFSLSPSDPCNSCPSEAECLGGFKMVPKKGYWRPDSMRNLFFECSNVDACLGSDGADPSLTGSCAEGYGGNLCSVCINGFSRQGRDICNKCPGLTSNIIVSTLVVIGALCALALAVTIAIRGSYKPRSHLAIYVKIFMNYLQMIVVAASLSITWPSFIRLFLNGQEMAGSMAEQLFSFDCILQEFSTKKLYFSKLLMTTLLPAMLILLSFVVWALIALCRRQEYFRHKLVASTVMILFVVHPSVTKALLASFSCKELVPGEYWLSSDLSLRCWDSEHIRELITLVVPSMVVWGFGLPTIALGMLIKARHRLTDRETSLQFSFLYKGYTERWFYWEFVILYRKLALICSSVFFTTISTLVQALSVLAVLLVCLFAQLHYKPFSTPNFNRLEIKSIFVSLLTIYAGLYFEAHTMSDYLNIAMFVLILLANGYFLLNWVRCVLPILIDAIKSKLLCGTRHYQIRPMPAKYDESSGESAISKFTGTHAVGSSDVSGRQISVPPVSELGDVTPPDNSPNLGVENSIQDEQGEFEASTFRNS